LAKALRIVVVGVVQGVGFRPFVARVARESGVAGFVRNLGGGEVLIHVEGEDGAVRKFLELLWSKLPPPAELLSVKVEEAQPLGLRSFEITKSSSEALARSIVPPDIAICEHCLREVEDPSSRWFSYPFNSCAWCGPRFSMMFAVPYDRENTSMRDFPLCERCSRDYEDPENERRYHAEGISCPKCGPRVWLVDRSGELVNADDPIAEAARLIDEGKIVALKGLGGFHVACRADDDEVVLELRRRKRRPQQPFALMAFDLKAASEIVEVSEEAAKLLKSPQRPIVLLPAKEDANVSKHVAPGLDTLGVMLPYTALHYLLLKKSRHKVLIMTSGNVHGKPMVTENEEALRKLSGVADYFLLHNRKITNRVDDSVVRLTRGSPVFLRRARGYAPKWILLSKKLERPAVAFGAELQNAGAVAFDDKAVLTQFVGDTDELEALQDLERFLLWLAKVYGVRYEDSVIVVDKHPRYNSSALGRRRAREHGAELLEVQHHVAHALSAMAERGAVEGVAVVMDGAGYGDDGHVWGGEVIAIYEGGSYERVAHLEYHKMPGGDLAALYPARMAFSILASLLGVDAASEAFERAGLAKCLRPGEAVDAIAASYKLSSALTSSTGRLLDAFSALLGVCCARTYEGEPAMKLEAFSRGGELLRELLKLMEPEERRGVFVVPTAEALAYALDELLPKGERARRSAAYTVQYAVGWHLGRVAAEKAKELGAKEVLASGGAAVNDVIYRGLLEAARSVLGPGARVYVNALVPPGDGGVALGQAYAAALMRKR